MGNKSYVTYELNFTFCEFGIVAAKAIEEFISTLPKDYRGQCGAVGIYAEIRW